MVPLGITGGSDNRTVFCERQTLLCCCHSPGTSSLSNTLSLQHQEPHHFAYSPYLSLERALGRVILFSWILWLSHWELPGLSWQCRVVCFFVKIFLPSFLSLRKAFSWTSSCEELVFWTDWNNLMNTWRLSVLFCHNCFFPKFSLVWIKNNLSWQLITMGEIWCLYKLQIIHWLKPLCGLRCQVCRGLGGSVHGQDQNGRHRKQADLQKFLLLSKFHIFSRAFISLSG